MENKKKVAAGLAALVGLGGAAFGVVTPVAAQAPMAMPHPMMGGMKHPEMRKALMNLNQAKTNLTNAAHDYEGHREKALDLIQKAIDEVNLGLQEKKH